MNNNKNREGKQHQHSNRKTKINKKYESTTMEKQKKYENCIFASLKQTNIENVSVASYPMHIIYTYIDMF